MPSLSRKGLHKRIYCFILAFALLLCDIPMVAYAQEMSTSEIMENESTDTMSSDETENSEQDTIVEAVEKDIMDEEDDYDEIKKEEAPESDEVEEAEAVEETEGTEETEEVLLEEVTERPMYGAVETSGIFNNQVEWRVELNENMSTRTLTIKPKDGLTDVTIYEDFYGEYPWTIFYESVTKVIIEDGIKNVPAYAFSGFNLLSEVEMADSIEVIGKSAFRLCERLGWGRAENEIKWPAELRVISQYAFQYCKYMDEYILPPHLEKIERCAFEHNDGLNRLVIPASVSHIDEYIFSCKGYLARQSFVVEVDSANPYYSITDGILYEDATGTALLCGKQDSGVITLRPGTKRIGECAFERMSVRGSISFDVEMPDSVISIGDDAFSLSEVKNIKLSENLRSIGEEAFCICSRLYEIDFPDSVTSIGKGAFSHTNIKNLTFPKQMTVIPKNMYANTQRFLNRPLYIPSGIVEIEDGAFYDAKIGSVSIPKSVKKIGDFAFDKNYMGDIYYGGTEAEWKELLNSHVDILWTSGANIHYYTDRVDLTFKDGILSDNGQLKPGVEFGNIGFNEHSAVKEVKISDWVNKYGTSMGSTDKVEQNNDYFAYVSITTDSFFNEATKVTINDEECEVFDISADGTRISFVTPTYISACSHSRVDYTVYETDGEKHWHSCPDCGERIREKAHTWGPDVLNAGVTTTKCTVCDYEVTKTNGRMRMNRTQISGGYYEVGEAIPTEFTMDASYAYSSCYELSEPVWYKGAYAEGNRINANKGLRFENDKYYVEFEIAIKEDLADQYYLKAGGITVRFVQNGLAEETSYRVVREDPNISGRQIQKVVFAYTPIDRSDLTIVLPTYLSDMTVAEFKQKVKFQSGGQEITPLTTPAVYDIYNNALADTATFSRYTPYIVQPMIDVPGYVDENSIKGAGIMGCRPGSIFNYRAEDNKTGVLPKIMFCYNPKSITVANVDVEAPLVGEKLGENVSSREISLFEITSMSWFDKNGATVSPDHVAQLGNNYGILVKIAPKDQYVFSAQTIFTVNGYEPKEAIYYNEGSALLTYEFPTVEEHTHLPVLVPADPGNCSMMGHVEYYQCNECGRNYLDRDLTQKIPNINTWLATPNTGDVVGGMIQDTSIHNFIFDQEHNSNVDRCQDCGVKNINFVGLKINVADVHYTGSTIAAPITIEGLSAGVDYDISEGANATLPGVYKAVIEGRNTYAGVRVIEWTISTDGMWISFDVNGAKYDYTGTAVKPSVKVYDGTRQLTAGKDYTIAYKNNVNAYTLKPNDTGFDARKAPTVIVTGKGDYSGKETANFVITPKSLAGVKVDDIYVNATGKPIAVKPVVKYGKKTLVLNKDYRIYNALNLSETVESVTASNTYKLAVRGIGNYKDGSDFNFEVTTNTLINKCNITVKNAEYDNGRIVQPEVTVKYQGKTLTMGTDYTLELSDREIGNATVKINGKGSYAGAVTKRFKITGVPISSLKLEPLVDSEYSGNEYWPTINLTYEKKDETPVKLKSNVDYTVKYTNNNQAGKGQAIITGKGKYTGTRTASFKITPMDVETYGYRISINGNTTLNAAYQAGGVKPDVSVTFKGNALKKGVDYTCTYSNNTSVGLETDTKAPTITYTFKGNFKGKITKKFNITTCNINDLSISVPDVAFNAKANGWISKPVIKDANGKVLVADKDYKVSYYADPSLTEPFTDSYNVLHNTVRAKIEGIEPYVGQSLRYYSILKGDISTAKIEIDNIDYDPEGVTTVKKSNIKITCGDEKLQDTDYILQSVNMPAGNKLGTGTVELQGVNDYVGTRKVNFKVVPRTISNTNANKVYIIKDQASVRYRKGGAKIPFRVMYVDSYGLNAKWIREGVDYTISYANINKAAKETDAKAPTIIVKFKGKFKGKLETTYEITKMPLGFGDIYNSDVIYNTNPGGWKQTKFTFKDLDKNLLKAGVDYELVPGYYKDSACTEPFTDADNAIGKDVYFKLAAKSGSNYQSEWIGSYKIVKGDISKAKVTVKNKNWTGTNVNLLPSDIDVSLDGNPLVANQDWEIVVCRNNVNRGNATVEIRGIGDYGGTKTTTFKIVKKPFVWWNR